MIILVKIFLLEPTVTRNAVIAANYPLIIVNFIFGNSRSIHDNSREVFLLEPTVTRTAVIAANYPRITLILFLVIRGQFMIIRVKKDGPFL